MLGVGAHAKSAATRKRIIDVAVELFAARGFDGTTLKDITESAEITHGTFYYYFDSKESMVPVIIDEGWPRVWKVFQDCTESRYPSLENVIIMTFEMMELMNHDNFVRVAVNLDQAFSQLSELGRQGYRSRVNAFTAGIAGAISKTDSREDITAEQIGEMVWIAVHGCHRLSQGEEHRSADRLAQCWLVLLRGIVPPESINYFSQFVERTAKGYSGS